AATHRAAAGRVHQAPTPTGSPTVTVSPSTGLLDGQAMAVTGNSFTAKTVYALVECTTGATALSSCGLTAGNGTLVKSDSSGSFSTSMTAVRTITPVSTGTPVDCATAGACVLAVVARKQGIVASTPISFADVVIIPPTVTANPSTGLLDGQTITVSGTNFNPDAEIGLAECPAGQTTVEPSNCLPGTLIGADGSGSFSSSYTVTRILSGPAGAIDCAQPSACVLTAINLNDPSQSASTPISFQDIVIIPPVLAASPSTGLVDGQSITVSGKGFRPHHRYALSECVAGSTDGSECVATNGLGNVTSVTAKGSGRFTTTIQVARVLTLVSGTVDCAQAPGCVIGAIDEDNPFGSVAAVTDVSFNPNVKPLPPLNLQLHIDPTGHIVAGRNGASDPQITGTISCDRSAPLPVQFQMQVTQPGSLQFPVLVTGQATCQRSGAKFSVTVPTPKRDPAVPGIAGVLLAVSAVSGSATQSITVSASVTLKST
ncbi:MAG TPA: neocarzinostatin apoprotein domain-containing protein, partial [Acidimicrobiales bacterium]|nr:neocarzinostatin apoprotein domain-containing protein [Acidimicrobiales bacterium]